MAKDKFDYPVHRGPEPLWTIEIATDDSMPITIKGRSEEARQDFLSLGPRPTNLEIGRWAKRWYTKPFMVDGVGAGMFLLACCLPLADKEEAEQSIERGECCGGSARSDGACEMAPSKICPLVRMAGRIVRQEDGE